MNNTSNSIALVLAAVVIAGGLALSPAPVVNVTQPAAQVLGGTIGTDQYNPVIFHADFDLLGTATTSINSKNVLLNSTSTGIVIRANDGNCYLFGLGDDAGSFTTSTASCTQ